MKEVVGYVRVSQVAGREGESFISPVEQRRAIEGWASLHGREVVAIFEDLDQSGKLRHRPGLDAAMDAVTSGQAQGIVVAKLDRFGRSAPHLGELLEILTAHDAALFTVAEGLDTSGHTGRMIATILSAVAEFEVSRHTENWYVARRNAVERGVFVGGAVPLGYEKVKGRLKPDRFAPVVRELFDRRISGQSWVSLADWLGAQTGQVGSVGSVRYIIGNRAYLGEIHAGQGIVNLSGHEAIIDRATFEAANVVRGITPSRSGRASGLLAGVLRCGSCRYAMKYSMAKTRHGQPRHDYRCKSSRNSSRCPKPTSVSATAVEPYVLEQFFARMGALRLESLRGADDLEVAGRHLADAEAELDAVLDRRLAEVLGDSSEAYIRAVEDRKAAVDAARQRLGEVRGRHSSLPDVEVSEVWPDLSLEHRRRLLAAAFDGVFVAPGGEVPDRLTVCWRGDGPEVPVRGRRWTPRSFPD
jgi:DNA invertase Pin-like site-specific DNA recombinase